MPSTSPILFIGGHMHGQRVPILWSGHRPVPWVKTRRNCPDPESGAVGDERTYKLHMKDLTPPFYAPEDMQENDVLALLDQFLDAVNT